MCEPCAQCIISLTCVLALTHVHASIIPSREYRFSDERVTSERRNKQRYRILSALMCYIVCLRASARALPHRASKSIFNGFGNMHKHTSDIQISLNGSAEHTALAIVAMPGCKARELFVTHASFVSASCDKRHATPSTHCHRK